MATGDKLIQVQHLEKHYNHGAIKALDDVSIDINKGDVMVVIGPSGSGKSTLLRSLNLLEVPTGGHILFDGVDITQKYTVNAQGKKVKVDINVHRQKMGMVFQHFNLFPHKTILQNMVIAPIKVFVVVYVTEGVCSYVLYVFAHGDIRERIYVERVFPYFFHGVADRYRSKRAAKLEGAVFYRSEIF